MNKRFFVMTAYNYFHDRANNDSWFLGFNIIMISP